RDPYTVPSSYVSIEKRRRRGHDGTYGHRRARATVRVTGDLAMRLDLLDFLVWVTDIGHRRERDGDVVIERPDDRRTTRRIGGGRRAHSRGRGGKNEQRDHRDKHACGYQTPSEHRPSSPLIRLGSQQLKARCQASEPLSGSARHGASDQLPDFVSALAACFDALDFAALQAITDRAFDGPRRISLTDVREEKSQRADRGDRTSYSFARVLRRA